MFNNNTSKVYQLIIEDIQNSIVIGELKYGDKLLTERGLAQKYQVSRASIREALRILDVIGIIECRQGSGNYISNNFSDFCFEPISLSFKLQNGSFNDILELRNMFEIRSAILAAANVSSLNAEALIKLSQKLRNIGSVEEFYEVDKAIHFSIAEYSKNKLLITLYRTISKLVQFSINTKSALANGVVDNKLRDLHINLCEAIAAKDLVKTQQYAEKHAALIIDKGDF
jgi:GntR family transcriptional regulator, transcriptional repressor for pyruvate dehydrogenase complex